MLLNFLFVEPLGSNSIVVWPFLKKWLNVGVSVILERVIEEGLLKIPHNVFSAYGSFIAFPVFLLS